MQTIKTIFCMVISLFMLLSSSSSKNAKYEPIEKQDGAITSVTFNVAAPWGNLKEGTGSAKRMRLFANYMNAIHPDTIGTQEMNEYWIQGLKQIMPDYDSYGVERGGDTTQKYHEQNAVFWLKDKYDAVEKNTFWLSETPEKVSRFSGAACNRVCSYVVLENKATKEKFIHMNTHLDHVSSEAANFGASVIMEKVAGLKEKYSCPIILTGDFNEVSGDVAYNTVIGDGFFSDSTSFIQDYAPEATYQKWGKIENARPIDHMFVSDACKVNNYVVLKDTSNGFVSDHNGIYIEWKF